jgi:hypothetical protein
MQDWFLDKETSKDTLSTVDSTSEEPIRNNEKIQNSQAEYSLEGITSDFSGFFLSKRENPDLEIGK